MIAERFLREIRLLASLDHPNITELHTAFRHNGELVMIMEFVEGQTLRPQLRERNPGDRVSTIFNRSSQASPTLTSAASFIAMSNRPTS